MQSTKLVTSNYHYINNCIKPIQGPSNPKLLYCSNSTSIISFFQELEKGASLVENSKLAYSSNIFISNPNSRISELQEKNALLIESYNSLYKYS